MTMKPADVIDRQLTRARSRLAASSAGHFQRRMGQFEVMNRAMILAALSLMLLIPALVALSAVLPLGNNHSFAANWAKHIGLSEEAAKAVRQLFNTDTTTGSTTV